LAAVHRGDGIVVGDGFVAFRFDFADDLVRGAVVVAAAVGADARVVDDDLRAFFGHEDGDTPADAAAGAGDEGYLIGEGVHLILRRFAPPWCPSGRGSRGALLASFFFPPTRPRG